MEASIKEHPVPMRLNTTVLLLAVLAGGAAPSTQGVRAAPPSTQFEAVSIKEVSPDYRSRGVGLYWVGLRDPSEWQAQGQPLLFVVMAAYGLGQFERSRIVGLPSWCYTELFDIEARVPRHARNAQVPLMVQAMLADRFALKAHWEERQMRAVAMTVAPGGPKMQRDPACGNPNRPPSPNAFRFQGGIHAGTVAAQKDLACGTWSQSQTNGVIVDVYHGFTMRQLASFYSGGGGRAPLLDRTRLSGAFDFTLRLPFDNSSGLTSEGLDALRIQRQHNLERAFRGQLGLNADFSRPVKLPVPVLVIDRVGKPTPN